jgi:hypothetical protein
MLWNPYELIETKNRFSLCICILTLVISEQQFAGRLGDLSISVFVRFPLSFYMLQLFNKKNRPKVEWLKKT